MLDARSPLGGAAFDADGISLREAPDFTLTLYAGSAISLRREVGEMPDFGHSLQANRNTFFRTGPNQVLVLGPVIETRNCAATPLSSGRARIEVTGPKASLLLGAVAAIDFSPAAFGVNAFAQTAIHHTPVLIHALPGGVYHIYGLRTFAQDLWDWLVDAAAGLR